MAAAYFAATQLEPTGYGAPDLGIAAVKQLHSDQDGNIKGDFGPLPSDFLEGNYRLYEKIVVDHEPITAIGTWDSRLGGVKAESEQRSSHPSSSAEGPWKWRAARCSNRQSSAPFSPSFHSRLQRPLCVGFSETPSGCSTNASDTRKNVK